MIPRPTAQGEIEFLLQARNLKYTYPGGVEALSGIDLRVRKGEYVAIVGGNGSGKTTLAKNLNGLLRPTSGELEIAGQSSSRLTVAQLARTIGYAFQNPDHQLFSSTVEDEVMFGPRNLGYTPEEAGHLSAHAIDLMGLSELKAAPPLSLSLGQRRRVSLASVIAMDPQVVILDEPTTGLDAAEISSLMQNIDMLNKEGHTLILITHDMRLVAEHVKRVLVMSRGRIILDSDPRGSFYDLEVLRQSSLEPPPVAELAHRLHGLGVAQDIFSPEELTDEIVRLMRKGGTA